MQSGLPSLLGHEALSRPYRPPRSPNLPGCPRFSNLRPHIIVIAFLLQKIFFFKSSFDLILTSGLYFQLFGRGGMGAEGGRGMARDASRHLNANDIPPLYVKSISLWIKTSF